MFTTLLELDRKTSHIPFFIVRETISGVLKKVQKYTIDSVWFKYKVKFNVRNKS